MKYGGGCCFQAVRADAVANLRSELGNQLAAKSRDQGLRYVHEEQDNVVDWSHFEALWCILVSLQVLVI